jgi:hypothetical protein
MATQHFEGDLSVSTQYFDGAQCPIWHQTGKLLFCPLQMNPVICIACCLKYYFTLPNARQFYMSREKNRCSMD